MPTQATFQSASAYKNDILALPVTDLDAASDWYCKHFSMTEVRRRETPNPTVILERDDVQIGFAINGGDPSQDGASIGVNDIVGIRAQLESNGVAASDPSVDRRDGEDLNVFFVVAPDGLCFYFNEPVTFLGMLEADALCMLPEGSLCVYDHEVVDRIFCAAAPDQSFLILALTEMEAFFDRCGDSDDLADDESSAIQMREKCTTLIGGDAYAAFIQLFFWA